MFFEIKIEKMASDKTDLFANMVYSLDRVLRFDAPRMLFHPFREDLRLYFVEKKIAR